MVMDQAAPSSSGLYSEDRDAGAGGKFRKPRARRPPRTPYDRPPVKHSQAVAVLHRNDGGWLSKLVDPAYRLISSGATRILPSFFSKSATADSTGNCENEGSGSEETSDGDSEGRDFDQPETTGPENPRNGADILTGYSDRGRRQDNTNNLPDGMDFSKIEQLVKGRSFSRDEINRLTKILNSQVPDVPIVEPTENKQNAVTGGEGEGGLNVAHELSRMSTEKKQDGLDSARVVASTPLHQSAVKEEVGSSPIDIAKAYMEGRTLDTGRITHKDERAILTSGVFASEQLIPFPSPQSSVCWPGSMVKDHYGFQTPGSASRRYGLQNFQRTPYSRTIYSKSKSKLTYTEPHKSDYLNIQSAPRLQSRTPLFTQSKDQNLHNGRGSVGPIRRVRHKFLSEVPASGSFSFDNPQKGTSDATMSKLLLPTMKKNLVVGESSTAEGFQPVDNAANDSPLAMPTLQSSNPAVRAILEHLERSKPSPKEKEAELKLATAWQTTSSSKATDTRQNEGANTSVFGKESSVQRIERGNSVFGLKFQQTNSSGITEVNKDIESSSTVDRSRTSQVKFAQQPISLGLTGNSPKATKEPWSTQSQSNGKEAETTIPVFNPQKKPPFHGAGSKPALASISVKRQDLRPAFSSDNTCSSGFSFPVSTSSGGLSEPPTPSIMPYTSAVGLPQQKNAEAVPSYSFGTQETSPPLVFSFPGIDNSSVQDNNASKINFNFGSDKKNRISFSSVAIA